MIGIEYVPEAIEDAKKYINNAKVSIVRRRWDGLSLNFYSDEGASYVDYKSHLVKTIYSKINFDPETNSMMEEIK